MHGVTCSSLACERRNSVFPPQRRRSGIRCVDAGCLWMREREHGLTVPWRGTQVAAHVPDKTAAQCKERWFGTFAQGNGAGWSTQASSASNRRGKELDPLKERLGARGTAKRQRQLRTMLEQVGAGMCLCVSVCVCVSVSVSVCLPKVKVTCTPVLCRGHRRVPTAR